MWVVFVKDRFVVEGLNDRGLGSVKGFYEGGMFFWRSVLINFVMVDGSFSKLSFFIIELIDGIWLYYKFFFWVFIASLMRLGFFIFIWNSNVFLHMVIIIEIISNLIIKYL